MFTTLLTVLFWKIHCFLLHRVNFEFNFSHSATRLHVAQLPPLNVVTMTSTTSHEPCVSPLARLHKSGVFGYISPSSLPSHCFLLSLTRQAGRYVIININQHPIAYASDCNFSRPNRLLYNNLSIDIKDVQMTEQFGLSRLAGDMDSGNCIQFCTNTTQKLHTVSF
jgi:hypothetical protein